MPLDLVTITARDFAASLRWYDAVLAALGRVRVAELVDEEEDDPVLEAVGWGPPDADADLWLVGGPEPTSGLHVRVRADTRAEVEAFHAAGVAHGGASHSAPRRWTPYRRGEFSAIVADPAGNLVEAVAPE